MGRYKRLLSDTFAFGISSFASKILVFLLIPLYTSVLTTEEYGISDLINNLVNVIYPILTLSIAESTLRFAFDKGVKKNEVLANSLVWIGISTAMLAAFTPFVKYINNDAYKYWIWFLLIYLGYSLDATTSQYLKGCNKTKLFAVSGVIHTIVIIVSNIIGLLVLKKGLNAYLFSLVLGYYVTLVFKIIAGSIWKDVCEFKLNGVLMKDMLKFSVPVIPATLVFWVNMSADKYIIIAKLGMAESGVYSVAYKIPSMLNTLTMIFTSAWTLSAIDNIEKPDNDEYQTKVYGYFSCMQVIVCSALIVGSQFLGKLLYAKEFYRAWECVPMLLIAYLFSGLSGFLASAYRASKQTNTLFISTFAGAIINIVLNFVFVERFGIIGAAYTTLISLFIVWLIRMILVQKIVRIRINAAKEAIVYLLLIAQAIIIRSQCEFCYVYISIIFAVIVLMERKTVYELITNGLKLISVFLKNFKGGV